MHEQGGPLIEQPDHLACSLFIDYTLGARVCAEFGGRHRDLKPGSGVLSSKRI